MKADHVVMHNRTHKFECLHCGETYQPNVPAPLSVFAVMAKEFARIHRFCKPQRHSHDHMVEENAT